MYSPTRQGELFVPPPPQREHVEPPTPVLATWSSICPLCSKYIAKNRSWIRRLPYPLRPRCTPDATQSLDDGGYYHARGTPINSWAEKKYCHERCWARHQREPRYEAVVLYTLRSGTAVWRLIDRRDQNAHYLYRLFGTDGQLLYVGVTFDVSQRIEQHYRTKPWEQMREVGRLTTQEYPSRAEALDAEHEAIVNENPLWNLAP